MINFLVWYVRHTLVSPPLESIFIQLSSSILGQWKWLDDISQIAFPFRFNCHAMYPAKYFKDSDFISEFSIKLGLQSNSFFPAILHFRLFFFLNLTLRGRKFIFSNKFCCHIIIIVICRICVFRRSAASSQLIVSIRLHFCVHCDRNSSFEGNW